MTSDAKIEDLHAQTPGQSASDESVRTYSLSKDGRRTAFVLLLGVASIWVFAIWSLVTIFEEGISGVEWVSAFLMLGILVVAPMVAWTLLEEMNCRISISDNSLQYRTLGGVDLAYGWSDLIGFERTARQRGKVARLFLGKEEQPAPAEAEATDDTDAADEPDTVLVQVRDGASPRISNPLVNFLHRQAHGSAVPIYGGLENRDELLGEIRARLH